jgi:hypothetical protein
MKTMEVLSGDGFRAEMKRQGLTQVSLAAEIQRLTGHRMAPTTISRMVSGERQVNPVLAAYLILRGQHGPPWGD